MKMSRKNIAELWKVLSEFKGAYNKKFSMYLVLNLKRLKPYIDEVAEMQKLIEQTPALRELQQKELDIVNKYIERDENGKPLIINNNSFKISVEHKEKYEEDMLKFQDENKQLLQEITNNKNEYERLMNEEIETDIMEIPFDCIPENIEVDILEKMSTIVKDFE
jgi:hypothetical protein